MNQTKKGRTKWRILVALIVILIASEVPMVRVWLTTPLLVQSESSSGDAAYVLSGGAAMRERLAAAADLVHMHRVPRIFLMRDSHQGAFNFKAQKNFTPTEWAVDYLKWLGVPADAIQIVDDRELTRMGTLDEARSLAAQLPETVNKLVLVTSPAHTRRSVLAFTRNLPKRVVVLSYPAIEIRQSVEFYEPLTVEYFKLLLYVIVA
jgi:uncharacterized SAM-binding protein YcdF (DUF218 family)